MTDLLSNNEMSADPYIRTYPTPSYCHAVYAELWWWYKACRCKRQNAKININQEDVFNELGRGVIFNDNGEGGYSWLQLRSNKDKMNRRHRNWGF